MSNYIVTQSVGKVVHEQWGRVEDIKTKNCERIKSLF
jgi:hypothetical protein